MGNNTAHLSKTMLSHTESLLDFHMWDFFNNFVFTN